MYKMKVVSTFSGCGGSSLGYKMAGMDVLACVEFIENAVDCYKKNFPDAKVFFDDVRNVCGEDILKELNLNVGELDILDGSPPCASFSMSGIREKGWNKVKAYSSKKQRVDDLFFEFIRLADQIRPKFCVNENVKGLTIGESKKVLNEIVHQFMKIGYTCFYKILNGTDFGAPQNRERVIFVSVRNDLLYRSFTYPNPTYSSEKISVKDAIENIKNDPDELKFLFEAANKYKAYEFYDSVNVGENHYKAFNFGKNRWDLPSRTLVQTESDVSARGICHPFEKRRHTIKEVKRLMGFPDDFILVGAWKQKYERLARSVNPQVICAVAKSIEKYYNKRNKKQFF